MPWQKLLPKSYSYKWLPVWRVYREHLKDQHLFCSALHQNGRRAASAAHLALIYRVTYIAQLIKRLIIAWSVINYAIWMYHHSAVRSAIAGYLKNEWYSPLAFRLILILHLKNKRLCNSFCRLIMVSAWITGGWTPTGATAMVLLLASWHDLYIDMMVGSCLGMKVKASWAPCQHQGQVRRFRGTA